MQNQRSYTLKYKRKTYHFAYRAYRAYRSSKDSENCGADFREVKSAVRTGDKLCKTNTQQVTK